MLKRRGVPHQVLNAKFHEKEAEIVAQAGKKGAVTIATNMAGRGTDILLGGNAEFMAQQADAPQGYDGRAHRRRHRLTLRTCHEEVLEARKVFHDLHGKVLKGNPSRSTTRSSAWAVCISSAPSATNPGVSTTSCAAVPAARATRAPPGSIISLEDDLMRLFGSERFRPMLEKLGVRRGQPI